MDKLCKIRDIQRAVNRFEDDFERLYNICLNEGMALCSLHKAGTLSSGELSEFLGLSSSNTSKVIKSIENKGLVERVMGAKDKRQMYFSLTEKGKALILSVSCDSIEIPRELKEIL
jgi:transcriptional regulator